MRYYKPLPGGPREDKADPKSLTVAILKLWRGDLKYKELHPYFVNDDNNNVGFFRKVQ